MGEDLNLSTSMWSHPGDDFKKPSWDGSPRRGSTPLPLLILVIALLVVIAGLLLGLMVALRSPNPKHSPESLPPATTAKAKGPDEGDAQARKVEQLQAQLLAKQDKELEELKGLLKARNGEAGEKAATAPASPPKPEAAPGPAAAATPDPLKERIEQIEKSVDVTRETTDKTSKNVEDGLKRQDNRLVRIESILESYRKASVFEPTDILVVACNAKEAPFATYKGAYEGLLLDSTVRFSYSGFRVGLLVATGNEVKDLVPLASSLKDIEKSRPEFRKFSPEVPQAGSVSAALNEAQNRFDDPGKEGANPPREGANPPREGANPPKEGANPPKEGANPSKEPSKPANAAPLVARRCVLVVHGGAQPPQPTFKPDHEWKNLKVDVIMLTGDAGISPDLSAWVEFCADRGGTFRPIRVNAPAKGGAAATFDPAIVDLLKKELARLTQPIIQTTNPDRKG